MRPVSIRWFDRLFFAALALSLPFNLLETWKSFEPSNATYLLIGLVVPIAVDCLLWFFISRRASNVAKWLWVFWLVIPLISLPFLSIVAGGDYIGGFLLHGALGATVEVSRFSLSIAAAIMLFRSDTVKWLTNRRKVTDASALR